MFLDTGKLYRSCDLFAIDRDAILPFYPLRRMDTPVFKKISLLIKDWLASYVAAVYCLAGYYWDGVSQVFGASQLAFGLVLSATLIIGCRAQSILCASGPRSVRLHLKGQGMWTWGCGVFHEPACGVENND